MPNCVHATSLLGTPLAALGDVQPCSVVEVGSQQIHVASCDSPRVCTDKGGIIHRARPVPCAVTRPGAAFPKALTGASISSSQLAPALCPGRGKASPDTSSILSSFFLFAAADIISHISWTGQGAALSKHSTGTGCIYWLPSANNSVPGALLASSEHGPSLGGLWPASTWPPPSATPQQAALRATHGSNPENKGLDSSANGETEAGGRRGQNTDNLQAVPDPTPLSVMQWWCFPGSNSGCSAGQSRLSACLCRLGGVMARVCSLVQAV